MANQGFNAFVHGLGAAAALAGTEEVGLIQPAGGATVKGTPQILNPYYGARPDSHTFGVPAFVANDYFEGASLDTTGTRFAGALAWTKVNWSANASSLQKDGALYFKESTTTSATRSINGIVQVMPAGAVRYRAKFVINALNDFNTAGMWLLESGTNKNCTLGIQTASAAKNYLVQAWSSLTAVGSTPFNGVIPWVTTLGWVEELWFELEISGTNFILRASRSGYDDTYTTVATTAFAGVFTSAPDRIGLYVMSESNSSGGEVICDTFLRVA